MRDIDKTIRAALQEEDRELFDQYGGEQTLLEMVFDTFKGQQRWLKIVMFIDILIFTAMAVICAFQFFDAETTKGLIGWSVGFVCCCLGTMMLKLWWWAQMDKNGITREIKRVELQIARLAARMKEASPE